MNKIKIIFFKSIGVSLLIIALLFFSCKEKKESKKLDVNTTKSDSILTKEEIAHLLQRKTVEGLIFLTDFDDSNCVVALFASYGERSIYFLTDTINYINAVKYRVTSDSLIRVTSDTLQLEDWTYLKIDSTNLYQIKINNKSYLYYSTYTEFMGTAAIDRDVYFNLLDLQSLQLHTLRYNGRNGKLCEDCIDGDFVPNPKLDNVPDIKLALLKASEKSPFIYHPTEKERNIYYYLNYEKKWDADNKADNHMSHGAGTISDTIYSTYYKESLFDLDENSDDARIENDRYIVITFTNSNILAYDKIKKKYFPVYIESCVAFCNKKISFINEHTIRVEYEDTPQDTGSEIHLDKIIFTN